MSELKIKLKEQEAIQLLELRADELMRNNLNWHLVSIVELPDEQGNGFEIGVYDFTRELKKVREKYSKSPKVSEDNKSFSFLLPVRVSEGQSRIIEKIVGHSYPEVAVKTKVFKVGFKSTLGGGIKRENGCNKPTPRVMGHSLNAGHSITGNGALGGIVVDKNNKYFAITAYHVVQRTRESERQKLPHSVYSPNNPRNRAKLGHVFWHKYTRDIDIALILIDDPSAIDKGSICCGIKAEPQLGVKPIKDDEVKICSSSSLTAGNTNIATVLSNYSIKRKLINSPELAIARIRTTDLGRYGDSGSLVLNKRNEVVGLMAWDDGTNESSFMPLEILKTPLIGNINNQQYTFKFDSFL